MKKIHFTHTSAYQDFSTARKPHTPDCYSKVHFLEARSGLSDNFLLGSEDLTWLNYGIWESHALHPCEAALFHGSILTT